MYYKRMKAYLDCNAYYDALEALISLKPTTAFISSYGMYAGISHDGQDLNIRGDSYATRAKKILDLLSDIQTVYMLIGLSPYRSCKGFAKCLNCEHAYYKSLLRLLSHKEYFPQFNWRVSESSHAKLVVFAFDDNGAKSYRGIGGGRNFNDSNWDDISFDLSDQLNKEMVKYFAVQYGKANKLTSQYLDKLSIKYDISSKVIEAFIAESL